MWVKIRNLYIKLFITTVAVISTRKWNDQNIFEIHVFVDLKLYDNQLNNVSHFVDIEGLNHFLSIDFDCQHFLCFDSDYLNWMGQSRLFGS